MKRSITFVKFIVTGLVTNTFSYSMYLLLTIKVFPPYQALSIIYPLTILFSYLMNKGYTFRNKGKVKTTGFKYIITYLIGYLFNLFSLSALVHLIDLPHQYLQLFIVFVTAILNFFILKTFVFRNSIHKTTAN